MNDTGFKILQNLCHNKLLWVLPYKRFVWFILSILLTK